MTEASCGFSPEAWAVVQRKPQARIIDVTAGNRHIWGKEKMRDDVIFTDKEPNLKIPPDLLCEWRDLPHHFPKDYFHCAIFDPPHLIRFDADTDRCKWIHKYPDESAPEGGSWWGYFKTRRQLVSEMSSAFTAISRISPRLCLKWFDLVIPIDNIIGLARDWRVSIMVKEPSGGLNGRSYRWRKRSDAFTWWVKLVRRGFVS